ncbi:ankyrin repeat domain-containing protein [Algisphaera agarilytica]|uniref:Ankyrin repeat protein n=1 Tax=Algisphaera agarilytica TaxID=1385975 RepID=A0A7X0H5H0_9BACT|nr:ankyrin repeat domain-containing protein [Algisphaera agarilytica]MBB6429641.1 ankyrin repeat protein [Algisphaera agarilytica]
MPDTESFIALLEHGAVADLAQIITDHPRRVNTFLTQPAPHGSEQWMPMHFAARAGHLAAVELMLEHRVHPDCRTRFNTPMHARQTPLHLAAAGGHFQVIERLLEARAEIEVRDAQLRSPIWLAARHGHPQVIAALAARRADLETRDTQQRTPLHAALLPPKPRAEQSEAPDRLLPPPPITFNPAAALALLDSGADPNATCPKEPEGFTPLHRCVALGDPAFDVAKRLIQDGANRTAVDPRTSRTPHALALHLQRSAAWIDLLA